MNKVCIWDFDQTIANTLAIEPLRKQGKWQLVYSNLDKIIIYDEIYETFEELKSRNYLIGVVTNSPKPYCTKALSHLKLNVDTIIGYHDTTIRKPFPDPINLALKNLNGSPNLSIGLGDNINDILAYQRANIKDFACLWGCPQNHFIDSKPTYSIITPKDLLNHI